MRCNPIHCAAKAAVHSYTKSLRFRLEAAGVEVIEIMPAAIKIELTGICLSASVLPRSGAVAIARTLTHSGFDVVCELAANHLAVFPNFFF
ncbi:MAG: hypothetical protein ABI335_25465 [Polyangiaceae bacterium]